MFHHDQRQLKSSINWQTAFIRDNLPVIGYCAWAGFENMGWGLLLCQVEQPAAEAELRFHAWNFTSQFVPGQYLADGLRLLAVSSVEIPELVKAIEQYNPQRDMMLLIRSGKSVEVLWLKDLDTTPPEYYQQVCNRWDEFMPEVFHQSA
jgi:hypothetical protein